MVIAYQDENCLRDLIAAPSILALGFASREEVMVNLKSLASEGAPPKQTPRISATFPPSQKNGELASNHDPMKVRRIVHHIVQSSLAAVVAVFYSKSPVSVMIRLALGASF